jgi:hypothetical protein
MWNILNIYIFLLRDPGFNFVAIGKYCVPCCKEAYTTYTFSLQGNLVFSLQIPASCCNEILLLWEEERT